MEKVDHILIVDNNSIRASEIQKSLRSENISESIKIAVNGEHALLCLEHMDLCRTMGGKRIIVMLNPETPIMHGLDFIDKLSCKNYNDNEEILLMVMKDYASPETLEEARRKGIKEFFSTPVDIASLRESIKMHFGEKKEEKVKVMRKPDRGMNRPMTMR